jgi:hypothetical protein
MATQRAAKSHVACLVAMDWEMEHVIASYLRHRICFMCAVVVNAASDTRLLLSRNRYFRQVFHSSAWEFPSA